MFVFSAESLAQSYRRMRYLQEYSTWRKSQVKEINIKQTDLSNKKESLERTRKEKESLLEEREKESLNLRSKESEQKHLVNDLQKKQRTLQSDLKKQQQDAKNLDRQIEKIIEEEAKKAIAKSSSKTTTSKTSTNKSNTSSKNNSSSIETKSEPRAIDHQLSGSFEKICHC